MTAVLRITDLGFAYTADQPVLRAVDLVLAEHSIVVLTGPSGCGKSTLLRLIAGLEAPSTGTIELDGRIISDPRHTVPPEHRSVGFVFQGHALFPHLTVQGNIAFGLRHLVRQERERVVKHHLDLLELDGLADRYPHEISGGQQQRVAIARSLARGPKLLLMDEPFSDLDGMTRARVRTEVKDLLKRTGTAAIIVSHDAQDAAHIADRIVELDRGVLKPEPVAAIR
ncbi:MAG: ABC transporter ATP-binding protein [Flavobacteriales bacterium]